MRKIIIYSSILLVLTLCVIYKSDYFRVELIELSLKNDLDSAAEGSVMQIDEERYGEGYIVFKDSEIRKYVGEILDIESDDYVIHIFDDSGRYRTYSKKGSRNKENFCFPYFYEDSQGLKTKIEYPCIIIEGKVQKDFYRLSALQKKKEEINRSVMYEVKGRKAS